ncbi:MAG: hypothetical protein LAO08_04955 [Acidobacteriia bacterium]|nr:hypothetical protein [Terriglobia bacterium]
MSKSNHNNLIKSVRGPLKLFTLSCAIVVTTAWLSLAQVTTPPAPDINASAAIPAPAGQAPDDVMKRLSDLVHAGKYAEAQQLTTGLLVAYPTDQRLVKAKALLDKSLAAAGSANATPASNQPTRNVSSTSPAERVTAEPLTGLDKVDYNALIDLARQAQQSTDLEQQKALLKQFMDQSGPFLEKHPHEFLVWQLRAASAISLNDPIAGYEAGQKLLRMDAADNNDANLQRLLAQLKNKGWLDKKRVEITEGIEQYSWMTGTWGIRGKYGYLWNEEFSQSGSVIEGFPIYVGGAGKSAEPDIRGTIIDSEEIRWEHYFSPPKPEKTSRYPIGWQPVISYEIDKHNGTMTMVIPGESPRPTSRDKSNQTLTLSFKKIGGAN